MTSTSTQSNSPFNLIQVLVLILAGVVFIVLYPAIRGTNCYPQAKKTTVAAQLDAVGKGLEMFQNDFNEYPDSNAGVDPIDWSHTWPTKYPNSQPSNEKTLSGAHWLARAMTGHDFNGIDMKGKMLQKTPISQPPDYTPLKFDDFVESSNPPGRYCERKSIYVDPKVFARDDDRQKFPNQSNGPRTGRLVILDSYGFPILYYRAKPKHPKSTPPVSESDGSGVYNQSDNSALTGGNGSNGWDFAGTGRQAPVHCLGRFAGESSETCKTFTARFTKANPESFVLISAGKDGIYGTADDITNIQDSDSSQL